MAVSSVSAQDAMFVPMPTFERFTRKAPEGFSAKTKQEAKMSKAFEAALRLASEELSAKSMEDTKIPKALEAALRHAGHTLPFVCVPPGLVPAAFGESKMPMAFEAAQRLASEELSAKSTQETRISKVLETGNPKVNETGNTLPFAGVPPGLQPLAFESPPPPPRKPYVPVDPATVGGGSLGVNGAAFSYGTHGHPHSCAEACKYVKRKGGCRNGAACTACHLCFWVRKSKKSDPEDETSTRTLEKSTTVLQEPETSQISLDLPMKVTIVETTEQTMPICPSAGSFGHPFLCARACKYAGRQRGCKDGASCMRCHLCRWHQETR